jgi:hypothetical protein
VVAPRTVYCNLAGLAANVGTWMTVGAQWLPIEAERLDLVAPADRQPAAGAATGAAGGRARGHLTPAPVDPAQLRSRWSRR